MPKKNDENGAVVQHITRMGDVLEWIPEPDHLPAGELNLVLHGLMRVGQIEQDLALRCRYQDMEWTSVCDKETFRNLFPFVTYYANITSIKIEAGSSDNLEWLKEYAAQIHAKLPKVRVYAIIYRSDSISSDIDVDSIDVIWREPLIHHHQLSDMPWRRPQIYQHYLRFEGLRAEFGNDGIVTYEADRLYIYSSYLSVSNNDEIVRAISFMRKVRVKTLTIGLISTPKFVQSEFEPILFAAAENLVEHVEFNYRFTWMESVGAFLSRAHGLRKFTVSVDSGFSYSHVKTPMSDMWNKLTPGGEPIALAIDFDLVGMRTASELIKKIMAVKTLSSIQVEFNQPAKAIFIAHLHNDAYFVLDKCTRFNVSRITQEPDCIRDAIDFFKVCGIHVVQKISQINTTDMLLSHDLSNIIDVTLSISIKDMDSLIDSCRRIIRHTRVEVLDLTLQGNKKYQSNEYEFKPLYDVLLNGGSDTLREIQVRLQDCAMDKDTRDIDFSTICTLLSQNDNIRRFFVLSDTCNEQRIPLQHYYVNQLISLFQKNTTLSEFYGFALDPGGPEDREMYCRVMDAFESHPILRTNLYYKSTMSASPFSEYFRVLLQHRLNDDLITKINGCIGLNQLVKDRVRANMFDREIVGIIMSFVA